MIDMVIMKDDLGVNIVKLISVKQIQLDVSQTRQRKRGKL